MSIRQDMCKDPEARQSMAVWRNLTHIQYGWVSHTQRKVWGEMGLERIAGS